MKSSITRWCTVATVATLVIAVPACNSDDLSGVAPNLAVLTNRSVTPALVKSLVSGVEIFTLIGSDDVLPNSPSFIFGGSADGTGRGEE